MKTRIIVIRHGKPLSEGYAEDALRPLSDEGKKTQEKTTSKLYELGYRPDMILSSPLLRAKQTAEVVGDIFGLEVEEESALGEDFDAEALLSRVSENQTVILVGHAPTLAGLVNDLVGSEALPFGLAKSGIAVVEFEGGVNYGKGTLVHYIRP